MSDESDSVWQIIREIDRDTAVVTSKSGNVYEVQVSDEVMGYRRWSRLLDRGVRVWGRVQFTDGTAELVEVSKQEASKNSPLGKEWEGNKLPYTTSSKVTVYTAGTMDWQESYRNRGDSTWRAAVVPEVETVEFLNPTETFFDHGADTISGCVSEDLAMVKAADCVLAYFKKPGQIGTMVEVFEAFRRRRPILCIFDPDVLWEDAPEDLAPKKGSPLEFRADSPYWFFVNYLVGDSDGRSCIPGEVPRWTGRSYHKDLSVWRAREDQIAEILEEWVEEVF